MMYGYGNSMFLFNNGIIATPAGNPLWDSLYAVYKAESNANDELGVYNGTAQGGLTYTAGKSGNAFTGNGTTGYVSLPDNSFNSLTNDFSVSAWINVNSLTGNQTIFSNLSYNNSNTLSNGFSILMRNGFLYFEIYSNTGVFTQLLYASLLSTNTWYNIVITRKYSTRSRIYINGSQVTANTSSLDPTFITTLIPIPSSICAWKYNASNTINYLNGKVDEVNVWTKELTSTEVTELYNAGAGKFYPY